MVARYLLNVMFERLTARPEVDGRGIFLFRNQNPLRAAHIFFFATSTMTLPPVRPLRMVSTLNKKGGPLHVLT
jgi:hypothetical protein